VTEIAKQILNYDQSQIEYYEAITRDMVGKVLRNHGIVRKERKDFILIGYEELSLEQVKSLIQQCQLKLEEYIAKRGERIWQHRKISEYISGTLKFEVLKRAKFRCELCGIPADEKALEVDHIIPRNFKGGNDLTNLEALCYSCNAMKRDRDQTDFRSVIASYSLRESGCLFCEIPAERVIDENSLAYAIRDAFPVTALHTLIIVKRHTPDYFQLGRPEINACNLLMEKARSEILEQDPGVEGFNIGINNGAVAGQTVMHCHIHLIPRRLGDVIQPRGGVRNIIPEKGNY
ncbi:HIT domain-containing protein, partial [bacterium]|nr:HIT domain-containing protein [bacterium]